MAEKKRVASDDSDSSDSDEDVGGIKMLSEDKSSGEKLEVLFEFRDPDDSYYNAISSLLSGFPCTTGIDSIQLTDEITRQPEVGTLVCQEQGNDVFAFLTALNLGTHRDISCLTKVKSYLLDKCPESQVDRLGALLNQADVGFLFKAQMVNFPPQLVPAMHRSLRSDMSWAFENAENETEEKNFNFEQLIFLVPFHESENSDTKKAKKAKFDQSMIIFDYFDDELMAERCKWNFKFQVSNGGGASKNYFVGSLTLKEYDDVISQMERMI